jgi:pimeloyl-ACP methyl ester carboxylesterase
MLNIAGISGGRRNSADSPEASAPLHIEVRGEGQPACLFLHGFGEGGYVWDGLASAISPGGQTIVPDLRGHGQSPWDAMQRYRIDDHAGDVARLIKALALRQFLLIGHSMGGAVALRIASTRPQGLKGLILVDCAPQRDELGTAHVAAEFMASNKIYATKFEFAQWLQATRPLARPERISIIAKHALLARADGRYEMRRDPAMRAAAGVEDPEPTDLWASLAAIACPILIVRGAASAILSRAMAERMMNVAANARIATIGMAGHGVMTDNPAEFVTAARAFAVEQLSR